MLGRALHDNDRVVDLDEVVAGVVVILGGLDTIPILLLEFELVLAEHIVDDTIEVAVLDLVLLEVKLSSLRLILPDDVVSDIG